MKHSDLTDIFSLAFLDSTVKDAIEKQFADVSVAITEMIKSKSNPIDRCNYIRGRLFMIVEQKLNGAGYRATYLPGMDQTKITL